MKGPKRKSTDCLQALHSVIGLIGHSKVVDILHPVSNNSEQPYVSQY